MKGRIGWQGLTADEFIEEGPYLVTGTDFENGRVCWERSYHISEKRYDEAFPFVLPIFKAYYIEQHSKHVKTPEDMEKIQKILDTMTVEKWKKFFGLIGRKRL